MAAHCIEGESMAKAKAKAKPIDQAASISRGEARKLANRTTEEVFLDHLELRKAGRLEDDIARNYDERVQIISNVGTFFGHDGVRHSARILRLLLPTLKYKFDSLLIHKNVAFEEWEAEASEVEVHNGIDAFVISKGRITIQTIWYESVPRVPEGGGRRRK